MLTPGHRYLRIVAGVYADRSGDLHVDTEECLQALGRMTGEEMAQWTMTVSDAIDYRCLPVDISAESIARLVAANDWTEVTDGR